MSGTRGSGQCLAWCTFPSSQPRKSESGGWCCKRSKTLSQCPSGASSAKTCSVYSSAHRGDGDLRRRRACRFPGIEGYQWPMFGALFHPWRYCFIICGNIHTIGNEWIPTIFWKAYAQKLCCFRPTLRPQTLFRRRMGAVYS